VQGDQCLDSGCYHGKVEAFLDREIAAHPGLIQIENGWRNPKEQRPGAVQRGHIREIEAVIDNPDAEPVMPCEAAKPAIVVYGKQLGRKLTVCTDKHCPVHDPQAAAEAAANPAPTIAPAPEEETEEEAAARQEEFERQRAEYDEERRRREEERKQQFEQEQAEYEAERNRKAEILKTREATFYRMLENAPATFSAPQLRTFLRALVNLDPYEFIEDLAQEIVGDNENETRSAGQVLLATIDELGDDKLTGFALRLALTAHVAIPREGETDYLTEAEQAFTQADLKPEPQKAIKKSAKPAPRKVPKKASAKKQIAA